MDDSLEHVLKEAGGIGTCHIGSAAPGQLVILEVAAPWEVRRRRLARAGTIQVRAGVSAIRRCRLSF